MKEVTDQAITEFQTIIWNYFQAHKRAMPWRTRAYLKPYPILVSELMLQQTQVARVTPKFLEFIHTFPTVDRLAEAPLSEVLKTWSGLGYNRRAKYLHQAARAIVARSSFPDTLEDLVKLPGVGTNTAGAILAYAYNQPAVFVETNVRSVFICHFFEGEQDIHDREIRDLLTRSLPANGRYREWYWAIMDYGAYLKTEQLIDNSRSKHYTKQSRFEGSYRQVRGQVLRALHDHPLNLSTLGELVADERLHSVVDDLARDGLIMREGDLVSLLE